MRKTLLIISDSPNTNAIFSSILGRDYNVLSAETSEDALGIIAEQQLNMVVTTLRHKKNGCFEFIEHLRSSKNGAAIPVIIIANTVNSELIANAHRYEVSDFLRIPIEPLTFLQKVSGILMKYARSYEKPDPITGLHKKQYAEEQISEQLSLGQRGALFLIDIDKYSFASGKVSTDIIKACGDILKSIVDRDTIISVTSSGFILFNTVLRTQSEIKAYADNLIEQILKQTEQSDVFISIGMAVTERHGSAFDDLYQMCDMGLGVARQNGKNRADFYKW